MFRACLPRSAELRDLLERRLGDQAGAEATRVLVSFLEGDSTVEQNRMLMAAGRGEVPIEDFLERSGHRVAGEMEFARPRWREDAEGVQRMLRSIDSETADSFEKRMSERKKDAQEHEVLVRERIRGNGGTKAVDDFERRLAETRDLLPWRETSKHHWMMGQDLVRRVFVELDRRLGLEDSIFYLTRVEVREIVREDGRLTPALSRANSLETVGRTSRTPSNLAAVCHRRGQRVFPLLVDSHCRQLFCRRGDPSAVSDPGSEPAPPDASSSQLVSPAVEGRRSSQGDGLRWWIRNVDQSELPRQLDKIWIFRGEDYTSPRVDSSPAVADGAVYVGVGEQSVFAPSGRVICLDAASGKLHWEHKTALPVFSSPAVSAGRLFVGEGYHQDADCRLYCLDAKKGTVLWTMNSNSHVESSAHVENERVFFGAGGDGIYCLEAKDGSVVWHFTGEHVDISPWVFSGLVFAGTGYGEHEAFCLSAKDGKVRWRVPSDLPVWGSPLLLGNRVFYGLGNGNFLDSDRAPKGGVICLAAATGKQLWRTSFPDAVLTAITYAKGKLFFGSRDGHLYAANPANGQILWKRPVGGPVVASPVVGNKRVGVVSATGRLMIASIETGEELANVKISRIVGEEVTTLSSPAVSKGRIFLGTGSGAVVCIGRE